MEKNEYVKSFFKSDPLTVETYTQKWKEIVSIAWHRDSLGQ